MTPDQQALLEQRRAKLIDVLIDEADPDKFATNETRDGRGDRNWQKANAIKTATLIMRIDGLLCDAHRRNIGAPLDDDEHDTGGASAGPKEIDKLISEAGAKVARIAGKRSAKS